MVRSIEGHGRLITRNPPDPSGTRSPLRVTTSASIPGSGFVAEPGVVATAPGTGEIRMQPVSVCHQVSTIGQRLPPITSRYHIHASGLIGSPTVPNKRNDERSCFFGHSSPHLMKVRIAVGAVYRMLTLCFSMISQKRSNAGQLGAPSYITTVAPFCNGP